MATEVEVALAELRLAHPSWAPNLGAEAAQGRERYRPPHGRRWGLLAASEHPWCRSWVIARHRSVTGDRYAGFLYHQHVSGL
jgi:hypothetical protein